MNPLIKLLYYESFCADLKEQHDFARNYAIFQGSFSNMEMAQKIVSEDNPDYSSSDEDFAESTRMVLDSREKSIEKNKKPRRRRQVVNG